MDAPLIIDNPTHELAVRNRLESFKLGGLPSTFSAPSLSNPGHNRSHSRSHSRNMSISSFPPSLPAGPTNQPPAITSSPSDNSLATFSFPPINNSSVPSLPTSSKRNSHHRRRSSVSTRTESAELMGVSLPELPPSNSDSNVNFGDKDSIRRRALWALEGKPDVSFAKVEIPDMTTPDLENGSFDFPTKPSFPSGSGGSFGSCLTSTLGNKRDSFKLLATSSSSKDQLHTLVEEEEEEEEELTDQIHQVETPAASSVIDTAESEVESGSSELSFGSSSALKDQDGGTDIVVATADDVPRPRPATLNLRPLSLTPENLASLHGLATPSWTPNPHSGLRRLSLSPAPPGQDVQICASVSPTPASRRPQLSLRLGNSNEHSIPTSNSDDASRPNRRSSITYKPSSHGVTISLAGLPTPEMTPTFRDRRYSITESVHSTRSEDEFFPAGSSHNRPLSASEQHFLVKSHNALLARITDLERALTNRRRISSGYARSDVGDSRPTSMLSDISSSDAGGEPSDEMLRLIADLKAERDELKRDVDGWRTRVGDMEKQMTMLTKRVEAERRDAWVARSQAGLLEIEKAAVEKKFEDAEKALEELGDGNRRLRTEKEDLTRGNEEMKTKMQELEERLKVSLVELEKERELRKLREEEILAAPVISLPLNRPPSSYGRNARTAFASLDSIQSSTTEVETEFEDDCEARFSFMLKAVQEEDELFVEDDEEDSGLAGYEDEEESDPGFRSSSSFDSLNEQNATALGSVALSASKINEAVSSNFQQPALKSSSWSTWTFPRVANEQSAQHNKQDSVDRFFGCLEDESSSEGDSAPCSPSRYSPERSKSLFSNALKDANEDESPFFLPRGVGVVMEEKRLGVLLEEEEEEASSDNESDSEMFGEMGGIRITLSPPQPEDDVLVVEPPQLLVQPICRSVEKAPQLPMLNFGDDEDDDTGFNFGRALEQTRFDGKKEETNVSTVSSSPVLVVSPPPAAIESSPVIVAAATATQAPSCSIPRPISPCSSSPSAIPRFSVFKLPPSPESPDTTPTSSPSTYITPPSKRGGTTPSFIPQLVTSPSPIRTVHASAKPKLTGTSTFIRQPERKPLMSSTIGNLDHNETSTNGSKPASYIAILYAAVNQCAPLTRLSEDEEPYRYKYGQQTQIMKSVDLTQSRSASDGQDSLRQHDTATNQSATSTLASIMTSPITAKLTSFMPFSWAAARAAPAAVCFVPSVSDSSMGSLPSDPFLTGQVATQHQQPPQSQRRGFVTHQQQLEKLKKRMEIEGRQQMTFAVALHCKNCSDGAVIL